MLGPIAKILRIVKSYVTLNKTFCRYNFKDEQVYSTQWDYIFNDKYCQSYAKICRILENFYPHK